MEEEKMLHSYEHKFNFYLIFNEINFKAEPPYQKIIDFS